MQYQTWVEEGKYGVIRKALQYIARRIENPPQLYFTFDPRISGVQMDKNLRLKYTEEMTILLHDQFWNLRIKEDLFSVELAFDEEQHLIVVPFKALRSFIDPDAKFALQFYPPQDEGIKNGEAAQEKNSRVIVLDRFRKNSSESSD
ncbi:ClpXP protease specificity-enhancing factor SspB [Holospora curviuscula]|uniref:Stringent starvation protein B n=1 Tax=Holospora curviuscula TaxID=1082868 RepID=A0A2S5RDI1_9PROT|nr:ClpXP protease specificity-enhancing factor SspB [Holospora curviuscula]PPE05370.1 Stringent starvation protein B [Holospora curviuscula]